MSALLPVLEDVLDSCPVSQLCKVMKDGGYTFADFAKYGGLVQARRRKAMGVIRYSVKCVFFFSDVFPRLILQTCWFVDLSVGTAVIPCLRCCWSWHQVFHLICCVLVVSLLVDMFDLWNPSTTLDLSKEMADFLERVGSDCPPQSQPVLVQGLQVSSRGYCQTNV